jgi:hypothetical protein
LSQIGHSGGTTSNTNYVSHKRQHSLLSLVDENITASTSIILRPWSDEFILITEAADWHGTVRIQERFIHRLPSLRDLTSIALASKYTKKNKGREGQSG